MTTTETIDARAAEYFRGLQNRICAALEATDGKARFRQDEWQRPGGGGGRSRVIEGGAVFEKAGVNFSLVHGELRPDFAGSMPGDGLAFVATGVSLVLHPRSPRVPTVHANFRCLRRGAVTWFGGGADLTPYYPVREDVEHFHRTWKTACDTRDAGRYPAYKKWCDEYFYLPHRTETRGVGGIFFDHLHEDTERDFAFVRTCGDAFTDAYVPIVERRRNDAWGDRERSFQLLRRGRYVEFNLLYDRGTIFGLKTDGRVESILMSLPPEVRWAYDPHFDPSTEEAQLASYLKAQDWLAQGP